MTPEQALAVLDRVAADLPGTRVEHGQRVQAILVLQQAIAPSPPPKPEPEPEAEPEPERAHDIEDN